MTRLKLALIALAAATVAACASEPPPPPQRLAEGRPHEPRGCPPVFSSPSGEPFRAAPGDTVCPIAAWFAKADLDADGAITRDEFRADAMRFFRSLDFNGDGVIEGVEVQRYERLIFPEILGFLPPQASVGMRLERAAYLPQMGGGYGGGGGGGGFGGQSEGGGGGRGGRGGGRGPGGGPGGPPGAGPGSAAGAGRFGLLQEPEPVSAADLNFDGRITPQEFATRADQRFRSLDPEGAGRLTLAALESRAPWMNGRGPGGSHRRHDRPPEA